MDKATKWEDVSFIVSSNYRKKVLERLNSPKTPTKLSEELDINIAHISRTLSELESKNMIICLSPKANKGKLYIISENGKSILVEVNKLN